MGGDGADDQLDMTGFPAEGCLEPGRFRIKGSGPAA